MGSGQDRQDPPPPYSAVAGGDQVSGAHGVDVPGNRPLGVHASQTPDSPAVTPHASGVPADAALPETGRSGSVVDSDGGVLAGQPTSPSGMTGRDADSPVDSVAVRGDSHRLDVAAVSSDSAIPSAEGAQAVPYPHQDPATAVPAAASGGVPVGVPVDAVRVPVPGDVVAGGGLVEFVRGGVADSSGGPVLLVAQGSPGAGVVVSPGQGSALAQGVGRDVVAVTLGQGGRGQQWTVFGADGSARPVAGPGVRCRSAGMGVWLVWRMPRLLFRLVRRGRDERWGSGRVRICGEIDRARDGRRSGGDESAARRIVQGTHDIAGLARGDAAVSLEDVVALVAAKHHELGDAHQDQVVEFSQALADRLGTRGSGLTIQASACPAGRSGESAAELGSGRHTSGGPSPSGAAVPVDDTTSGAGDQRVSEELAAHAGVDERVESGSSGGGGVVEERSAALSGGEFVGGFPGVSSPMAAPTEADVRERIAALQDAVELVEAQKAELEVVQARDEDREALWESERALRAELAVMQAELAKFV
ncbi:hypothetical protein [Saccharopolyspora spinosa]|uniref:hypothetical protein n=1 Tax=Saccharopolyspora spinosa TaxID=60894 RepID=UPI00376EC55E